MGEREYSMLRNLLLLVIVLLVVSVGSDVYLGRAMAENSRVFGKIYALLESGMNEQLLRALTQLEQANQQAEKLAKGMGDADARMKQAEERMVQRLKEELPPLMDQYVETRLKPALRAEMKSELEKFREQLARDPEMRRQIREALVQGVREEMRGGRQP